MRQECLEVALADRFLTMLWGGTTDAERRVSLALMIASCPTIRHRTSLLRSGVWSWR